MYMINVRLVSPREKPVPDKLTDLFTSHFVPADHIEHLWTRADRGQIDLVLFLLAECEAEALLTARAACLRALASTQLRGWRLSDDLHISDKRFDDCGGFAE
ncbi:hypothetical protein ACFZAD_39780 [Streptomyces iakyrus]|uniref:hypothetical protein n=1 Tax=Streptomyces iakyrus TaxID=68219 RepID=UPI0036E5BEEE